MLGSRSKFWTICLIENRTKAAFSNFRRFPKKQESLKLVNTFVENSSLKGISGQNMSDPLKWSLTDDSRFLQAAILKNFARFYTAEDENYSVVLLCHSSLIEVVVHEGNVRSLKDDLQANLGNSPGDQRDSFEVFCAREVFRQLVLLLECLRKEFCWLKRMKYQVGVICPVCCHKRLVKYCHTHHKQDCEREECLHFISEWELRNANQSITCTRSAAAVDNKVYIEDFTAWFASPREEVTVAFIDSYT